MASKIAGPSVGRISRNVMSGVWTTIPFGARCASRSQSAVLSRESATVVGER